MVISTNELNNLENNLANLQSKGISYIEVISQELNCTYAQFKELLNNSLPIMRYQNESGIMYTFISYWDDSLSIMYTSEGDAYGGSSGGNMWLLH